MYTHSILGVLTGYSHHSLVAPAPRYRLRSHSSASLSPCLLPSVQFNYSSYIYLIYPQLTSITYASRFPCWPASTSAPYTGDSRHLARYPHPHTLHSSRTFLRPSAPFSHCTYPYPIPIPHTFAHSLSSIPFSTPLLYSVFEYSFFSVLCSSVLCYFLRVSFVSRLFFQLLLVI